MIKIGLTEWGRVVYWMYEYKNRDNRECGGWCSCGAWGGVFGAVLEVGGGSMGFLGGASGEAVATGS